MTTPAKWKPQPADSPCKCCRCDHPEQIAEADDWLGHTCFVIHQHGCDGRHGKRDACNQDAPVPPSVEPDDVVTRAQALYTAALDSKPGKGEWPTDALVDAVTVIPDLIRENHQLRETIARLDLATDELADSVTQLNAELVEVQSRNAVLLTPDEPVATDVADAARVILGYTPHDLDDPTPDDWARWNNALDDIAVKVREGKPVATTVDRETLTRMFQEETEREFIGAASRFIDRVLALLNGETDE